MCIRDRYIIDGYPTIITNVKNNVAKGFIVIGLFKFALCYIVKGKGYVVHGNTLKDACEALEDKIRR